MNVNDLIAVDVHTSVHRARFLPVAPSLERGDITDKGSVNQRVVLRHCENLVAELCPETPGDHVGIIAPAATP
jgi:feruloyl-CoA synthase